MTQLYRIIGGDKKEYGPVNADDIHTWLAEGRLNAQSLVREEQSSEWKPLSAYPEFAEALGLSGPTAPAGGTPPPLSSADWTRQVLAEPARIEWPTVPGDPDDGGGSLFSLCYSESRPCSTAKSLD